MNRLLFILTIVLQYASALQLTRRALPGAAAAATAIGTQNAFAAAKPVLVLGANGGTGLECVRYLQKKGRPCIAATRTGEFVGEANKFVTVAKGDVTDAASLASLITDQTGAVIFAASASRQADAKKSSNAKAVDNIGLVNCAKLCIEKSVPRLVVVSSGGVSKPSSAVYIFLNLAANGIMDAKIAGEDAVRRLYAAPGLAEKNIGYTVVRPGGLLRDPGMGVSSVELNQGDTKSGRINRADVAAICIESLESKAAFDTTFECYYKDTAKGLDDVMKSNAAAVGAGVKTTPTETSTGRERRGDTWPKLFEGLERDRVA